MRTLEKYLSWTDDELCIPEIVVEEMACHFRKQYQKGIREQKLALKASEIIGDKMYPMREISEAEEIYKKLLQERLQALNARILPVPNIGIKSLLERDLNERKPFDESGKGFRDTLIWESIIEDCSNHDEKVVIITNDNAFISTSNQVDGQITLHEDLLSDLKKARYSSNRVSVTRELREFNEKYVKPLIPVDGVYKDGEQMAGTFAEVLRPVEMLKMYEPYILRAIDEELSGLLSIKMGLLGKVSFIRWPENVRLLEALDLQGNEIQAIIRTSAIFDAEIYIDQDEYDKLLKLTGDKDKIVILLDTRWNQTQQDLEVKLRVQIFTDVAFIWNTQDDIARGVDLLKVGFREKDLISN